MKTGARLNKEQKKEENELITKLISFSSILPENMSDSQQAQLLTLQLNLDKLYINKAKGAFIRSKAKWLEEGEQNSSYFFKLEKQRQIRNSINKLSINGDILDNYKDISKFCEKFYQNLYKSRFSVKYMEEFFKDINNVKPIGEPNQIICDSPITLKEISDAISKLRLNKSPGTDGLTSEFYKAFSIQLAPFLLQVIAESITKEQLPPSLCQGLITLIPKPQKDILLLDNWRPITLLNNDYKIFALCLACKLKKVLHDIIEESQNGFMTGRYIIDNIRLVLDLLDYSDLISENSFILFLDFQKAFDSLEHNFLFKTLDLFNFGEHFKKSVRTLYSAANSSIKLPHGTTSRFNVECGIRQGCPLSAFLFLLPMQILAYFIKSSRLKGITIAGREIQSSQLADDTTLFLKDATQIDYVIKLLDKFSLASGLRLNLSKCELFPIKYYSETEISGIPVKQRVKYLGVNIIKDENKRQIENFNPLVLLKQKKLNMWSQRDLSISGRVLLSKAEGLSSLVYASSAIDVSNDIST